MPDRERGTAPVAPPEAYPSSALPAQQQVVVPAIDFDRWARFIVRELFDTQPHEAYLLMGDPYYWPELIDALRAEFMEARAVELGTILFDGPRAWKRRQSLWPRDTDVNYKRLETAAMRRLYERADIFLWLPGRTDNFRQERSDRRLFEHLVEGSSARGLHMHWIQGPDRFSQQDLEALGAIYEAALDIDYAALSAHQDRIIAAIKGQKVHITTPSGTDLTFYVPENAWFHKNDGRLDRHKAARARSVRDRQMELPAGALRFIPDVTKVDGVLAVPSFYGASNVRFSFENGLVVSVIAEQNEEKMLAAWADETGDKDRLAEVVIGTNPKLPDRGPGLGDWPPYYGYGDGILRIALGENWESGGTNRSSMEAWFYFIDATISAGDTLIVKDGELVVR
ncbi:MAG: hypothetical protein ACE5HV_11540 [Acidobacteriota bacterium]